MNQDILNFFSKLSNDEKLRKEFLNKPFKEKYSLAIRHSENPFSEKEFMESMAELYKYLCEQSKEKERYREIDENNLGNISGGANLSMVDIVNAGDLSKDFTAFQNANAGDKFSIVDAIDDMLNGGALLVSSVHGFVKKFKEGSKRDNLKELQKKRKKMELLLEESKLNNIEN